MSSAHLRHHADIEHRAFGSDRFGVLAERFARFFGTPRFIIGQTVVVACWLALNGLAFTRAVRWDKPWFVLLNLLFSLQAAYAAPLILLAQTRQADRDKQLADADARHREEIAAQHAKLIEQNTTLTADVHAIAVAIRKAIDARGGRRV